MEKLTNVHSIIVAGSHVPVPVYTDSSTAFAALFFGPSLTLAKDYNSIGGFCAIPIVCVEQRLRVAFKARHQWRMKVSKKLALEQNISLTAEQELSFLAPLTSYIYAILSLFNFFNPFPRKFPSCKNATVNMYSSTTTSWACASAAAAGGCKLKMLARPAALAPLTAMPRPGRR